MIKTCLLISNGFDTLHIDIGIDIRAVCKREVTLLGLNPHFLLLANDMQKRCACVYRHDV
ncbi:hypothetical protein TOT_020000150 [Theileria orientalis strain Shintoku]|uniref:Uncharacterized protein n=1 Tax=Theileria orientalis strain Shintoku TaxID=869250 RepID=J4C7Z1_THEOR|nr:hypothetical protein TOT_020000150 [Theileria orientalis strain Shintoku]PVC53930.1 hypothetical protein MACL_00003413 [Theileria orientalis]BAM39878.1 hypothetical protein TOT_020000150 [Theileria orientalis strain Shintoku]|eukprot:XP_009690179.1 hypothetical protein TOT_020000150 [Theileria orientalis strain Shintoku]